MCQLFVDGPNLVLTSENGSDFGHEPKFTLPQGTHHIFFFEECMPDWKRQNLAIVEFDWIQNKDFWEIGLSRRKWWVAIVYMGRIAFLFIVSHFRGR